MKIDCTIDEKLLSLSLNSNKPLSLILEEDFSLSSLPSRCEGGKCGLCVVLLNNKPVLSCMVPAFKIKNKEISTFDFFRKKEDFLDIKKAYENTGFIPCEECYSARTMVIESLLRNNEANREEMVRTMNMVRCPCMQNNELFRIIQLASSYRRTRKNAKAKEF